MTTNMEKTEIKGALQASLERNKKALREDRAQQIADDARVELRRKVEDAYRAIRRLRNDRTSLLDMSPNDSNMIINAKEFDGAKFADILEQNAVEMHKAQIRYQAVKQMYEYVIGEPIDVEF